MRPFNEEFLWKGTIQRANYPKPFVRPDMDLPKINSLTGKPYAADYEYIYKKTDETSRRYWEGVNKRKEIYRIENKQETKPLYCEIGGGVCSRR